MLLSAGVERVGVSHYAGFFFCVFPTISHLKMINIFSPTRPSGLGWSSSGNVHVFIYFFMCPLLMTFFSCFSLALRFHNQFQKLCQKRFSKSAITKKCKKGVSWFWCYYLHTSRESVSPYAGFSLNRPYWADSLIELPCTDVCLSIRAIGCSFFRPLIGPEVT